MRTSIALLLSGLAAQQVAATWHRDAPRYNSPQYNNNECSDQQKGGFDWKDLPTGGFSNYGDFSFGGGWSCANSFGKRDSLTKRTFNSKCVKNTVGKDKPAAFDCSARKDGFSVTEMQVSVEYDCDLEFHYQMPDNSICKHVASCKTEGTTVKNTQCGGAKSVEVYLGNHNQEGKDSCEIGLHHIGFDCNPGYGGKSSTIVISTPTPTPSQPAEESSSIPVESTPYETLPVESSTPVESVPYPPAIYTNSSSVPVYESTPIESKPAETTDVYSTPIESQPAETTDAYSTPIESQPAETTEVYSTPVESQPAETTEVYSTPVESQPAESTDVYSTPVETPGYTPSSSALPEESSVTPPAPSSPATPGGPPSCLPQCMNTWLEINSDCKDNTDVNCYCKNPDFTKNVIECVQAWASDEETQQALSYLVGICASYVPQNPGIITNCPSGVPLGPTNPPAAPPAASAPVTSDFAPVPSSYAPIPSESAPVPSGPAPVPSESAPIPSSYVPVASESAPIPSSYVPVASESAPIPSSYVPVASESAPIPSSYVPVASESAPIPSSYVPVASESAPVPITTPAPSYGVPAEVPCTTITYESTTVTVPQVVFTTASPEQPGETAPAPVDLVPGTPAPAPAETTAPYPIPTSLGTVVVPTGNGTATSTGIAEFTGAASSVSFSYTPALMGAVLAFFAL